ncbi:MAG: tetratricopeptide repeat protein [Polaromonas sp.]|nr:tetratricopeptide repeat protein [Polaromonas sp.]
MSNNDHLQDLGQRFELGLKHHQAGNLNLAVSTYREILSIEPRHADALHLLGEALYRLGQFDESLFNLNRAIEVSPHHFYLNTRGIVFLEYGYLLEAEQDLRRAIKVLPNYLEAHINLTMYCAKRRL